MKAVGRKVAIEKIDKYTERYYGDIYIPTKFELNTRLSRGKIVSVGKDCKYNIKEGDIVMYDTMSVFNEEGDIVITNDENVIIKIEE